LQQRDRRFWIKMCARVVSVDAPMETIVPTSLTPSSTVGRWSSSEPSATEAATLLPGRVDAGRVPPGYRVEHPDDSVPDQQRLMLVPAAGAD
jgi:hypothetical protein